jgi:hypothetical protein
MFSSDFISFYLPNIQLHFCFLSEIFNFFFLSSVREHVSDRLKTNNTSIIYERTKNPAAKRNT